MMSFDQSSRLFISNLPENFNEHDLRNKFSSFGNIINFDIKNKPGLADEKKTFAFVTMSATNSNIESCIRHFSNEDFDGHRLYVTRARESFLDRLQREREQAQKISKHEGDNVNYKNDSSCIFNLEKKKINHESDFIKKTCNKKVKFDKHEKQSIDSSYCDNSSKKKAIVEELKKDNVFFNDKKKQESDRKRLESMKKKRQEFNDKKNIIKTGLISIDQKQNKKIIFSDTEEANSQQENTKNGHCTIKSNYNKSLFDDRGSDDDIDFKIKEQYEGKKGQKVLDLQSRYKSDKRFVLDERFIEDSASEKEESQNDQEKVDLNQADEKSKQLDILQNVLGISIRVKATETESKTKSKLGMLRFDPSHPEHSKYLVSALQTQESVTKSKKKKSKETKEESLQDEPATSAQRSEVSKEQFYKISDTLRETIVQPTSFSLRSLFAEDDKNEQEDKTDDTTDYIPLKTKNDSKIRNPLDPGEKNPFVYDSSESDNDEENTMNGTLHLSQKAEVKTVWRENLFFSATDQRLKDGLLFFSKQNENEGPKDRRELKSLMKKRIYNKDRKNTMFQKKIGGRKKTMKKKFRK